MEGLRAEGEGVEPAEEGVEDGCSGDGEEEIDGEELVPGERVLC